MKQEIKVKDEPDCVINLGDMFEWTDKCGISLKIGKKFIYLGEKHECIELPFTHSIELDGVCLARWYLTPIEISERIDIGEIKRLPKGSQFIITQD